MTNAELQDLLYREIPLCSALQLQVSEASSTSVTVEAPLEPNRNLHGTAFAGSQYCIATLAGWSLATLYAASRDVHGAVVLRHADVRYQRPVQGRISARADLPAPEQRQAFIDEIERRGRGRLLITISIEQDGRVALQMAAEYVVSQSGH